MKERYTDPILREKIKKEVLEGSSGGKPGQWSARKAQLVASKYKRAGGGYGDDYAPVQANLKRWTQEKWRTNSGKPSLETGERYLPSAAWDKLTPAQKAATTRAKRKGMAEGKQFVKNTPAALKAGQYARKRKIKDD